MANAERPQTLIKMMNAPPNQKLRIVFAGTPEFAAQALKALLAGPHQIIAVYTQPDRPAGRGRQLSASPVKALALTHNLPVFQPNSLKNGDALAELQDLRPDLMVVAAYGLILPPRALNAPKYGCINIHASLLPRWRGAAPIQHALLAGDKETGITIMQMDAGLDTGAMLFKMPCAITPKDTAQSLHDKLAELGGLAISQVLQDLPAYQGQAQEQDETQANYASKLEKSQAQIHWNNAAEQLERLVRAFNPWPVAFSDLEDMRVRIWEAKALSSAAKAAAGTILAVGDEGIDVACGTGQLRLKCIQLSGGKALPVTEVLKARRALFQVGACFNAGAPEAPIT